MAKVFKIFGVVSLLIFISIFVGVLILFYSGSELDKSSKHFADNLIENNVKGWKKPIETNLLSASFKKTTSEEQFDKFWKRLSDLGEFKTISEGLGEATIKYNIGSDKEVTASYIYEAEFSACKANIHINLIQEYKKWKVQGFRFISMNSLDCFDP